VVAVHSGSLVREVLLKGLIGTVDLLVLISSYQLLTEPSPSWRVPCCIKTTKFKTYLKHRALR